MSPSGEDEPTAGVLSPSPSGAPALAQGAVVAGRYRIQRFIARGGMGEVYEAEDRELREYVALKTILPAIAASEGALERFKREILVARRVTHPNVCRIFDLGRHQVEGSGPEVAFLSMELLRGETLSTRLRRAGRLAPEQALPVLRQIAAGLDAAHAAGVVHRDLKSSNVMLVPPPRDSETERAVITDFGLARRTLEQAHDTTATLGALGTPAYMAPEQVEGKRAGPAADVYAFGIVIYEMVTGRTPFEGDTPLATAVKRLTEPPPSPRKHAPDLDPRWEGAILRCLERKAEDRFARASDAVAALEGRQPARPPSRSPAAAAIVGAAVVAAAVLAGGAFVLLRSRERAASPTPGGHVSSAAPTRKSVAVLGFKNLSGRADAEWLSAALAEMLATELAAGENVRMIAGESVVRARIDLRLPEADSFGRETLARIRRHLGSDVVVLGSFLSLGEGEAMQLRVDLRAQDAVAGETVAVVGDSGAVRDLFAVVSRAGGRLREKLGLGGLTAGQAAEARASLPETAGAARLYAEGLAKLRRFEALEARRLLERAVAADPRHPFAHAALAEALSALGHDAQAREEAAKAHALAGGLSREGRLVLEGRHHEANRAWDQAEQAYRTLFGFFPDNPDYGLHRAEVQTRGGRAAGALETLDRLRAAVATARDDPRVDIGEAKAAGALGDHKRRLSAARRAGSRAQAAGARLLVAAALIQEANALWGLGELPPAKAALEQARGLFETAAGPPRRSGSKAPCSGSRATWPEPAG